MPRQRSDSKPCGYFTPAPQHAEKAFLAGVPLQTPAYISDKNLTCRNCESVIYASSPFAIPGKLVECAACLKKKGFNLVREG